MKEFRFVGIFCPEENQWGEPVSNDGYRIAKIAERDHPCTRYFLCKIGQIRLFAKTEKGSFVEVLVRAPQGGTREDWGEYLYKVNAAHAWLPLFYEDFGEKELIFFNPE